MNTFWFSECIVAGSGDESESGVRREYDAPLVMMF
jgi:hypothetical protein